MRRILNSLQQQKQQQEESKISNLCRAQEGCMAVSWPASSLGFLVFFLLFWEKSLGIKHAGWIQTDEGSIQAGWTQNALPALFEGSESSDEVFMRVGDTFK